MTGKFAFESCASGKSDTGLRGKSSQQVIELEEVKTLDFLKCVVNDGKVLNSGMAHPVIKVYR